MSPPTTRLAATTRPLRHPRATSHEREEAFEPKVLREGNEAGYEGLQPASAAEEEVTPERVRLHAKFDSAMRSRCEEPLPNVVSFAWKSLGGLRGGVPEAQRHESAEHSCDHVQQSQGNWHIDLTGCERTVDLRILTSFESLPFG